MAIVIVAPTARAQLDDLIDRYALPADTRDRVRSALGARHPLTISGRRDRLQHHELAHEVNVVTIEDAPILPTSCAAS